MDNIIPLSLSLATSYLSLDPRGTFLAGGCLSFPGSELSRVTFFPLPSYYIGGSTRRFDTWAWADHVVVLFVIPGFDMIDLLPSRIKFHSFIQFLPSYPPAPLPYRFSFVPSVNPVSLVSTTLAPWIPFFPN